MAEQESVKGCVGNASLNAYQLFYLPHELLFPLTAAEHRDDLVPPGAEPFVARLPGPFHGGPVMMKGKVPIGRLDLGIKDSPVPLRECYREAERTTVAVLDDFPERPPVGCVRDEVF